MNNMKDLGEFNTVEGFWGFFNYLPQPSEIFWTAETGQKKYSNRTVNGYSLFKKGIRPEWEDRMNMTGGEYFCRMSMTPMQLDQLWENLLLGTIGETMDPADEICGARLVDKTNGSKPLYRYNHLHANTLMLLRQMLLRQLTIYFNNLLSNRTNHMYSGWSCGSRPTTTRTTSWSRRLRRT